MTTPRPRPPSFWMALSLAVLLAAGIVALVPAARGAAGSQSATAPGAAKPDDNRFTPVVLVPPGELDEPMTFDVARDGRVFIIERKGRLKMYDPVTKTVKLIATIPVNTKYTNAAGVQREAEEGLVGFTLDPGFEKNHWVYMLYADPEVTKHTLARWELIGEELIAESKIVLLEYGVQREQCCHTGGGMTWDRQGNLYVTVGNNTANSLSAQTDERPGRTPWDDQRGSANTNDLRGKILRIHPEPDGTYTIPAGNLFPPGTARTRPEIYTMGNRNPWRPSIDSRTGYLYWGEVGPDANEDTEIGPRGYDELNQARSPGNFGWPYFVGENHAFPYFDFFKGQPLQPKDPARPINDSVNSTGLRELPPAQPAFISYPYGPSEKFPEVGSGARSANGGPIYHRADFRDAKRPFPEYYEGKWFVSDFSRGWIMVITLDEQSNYVSMERFLPSYKPVEPIDAKFGPDGDFYVLDYGSTWFAKSPDSQLVRIEYTSGNRAPSVQITADRTGGIAPFKIAFSSAGTQDFDGDPLTYEWTVESAEGGEPRVFKGPNPTIGFDRNGIYVATLTVKDPAGAEGSASLDVIAGNEPPRVSIDVTPLTNRTFFTPGTTLSYSVQVSDREDGSLAKGIGPEQVALSIDYVPEGFDVDALRQGQAPVDASTRFAVGRALMARSDCATCHNREGKSRGPTFAQLAEKYQPDAETLSRLAAKVRDGSTGVWGGEVMPAHPLITAHEAREMVHYMLGSRDTARLPLSGTFTPAIPEGDTGRGSVVIRAVYTDRGANKLPAQTAEAMRVLRSPTLSVSSADIQSGVVAATGRGNAGTIVPRANSHIGFRQIDLTGMGRAEVMAQAPPRGGHAGGTLEVRLDSPTGPVIGQGSVGGGGRASGPTASEVQAAGGRAGGRGRGRGTGPAPVVVQLKPTAGLHDLYIVFRNAQVTGQQPLMTVSGITLLP
ncbi:MAG TPA: PQQ-dependent sugar dehydrogenase [Vicinamibacterales bacterium]|nr:PQQ-dependent sugar dehydrogenase [Vicinamibacterales bacterium]